MSSSTERTTDSPERTDESVLRRLLSHRRQRQVWNYGLNLLTALIGVLIVFPLFWMVSTSLRPRSALFTRPAPILPTPLSFEHYEILLTTSDVPTFFVNSVVVGVGVVTITTVAATLGGYGLTRIDIPLKKTVAKGILFGYMFPSILLSIPMFIFWRQLGIINSYVGLILAETAIALPFSLWLMWKFFQTVPISLEESAQMAGATRFRAFYEIALPLAKPGITAIALFSFALSWGAYTIPKIIMSDAAKWPLTVGLDTLIRQNSVMWGQIMAASTIMIIPPLLFIFFLQKSLLRGFRVAN